MACGNCYAFCSVEGINTNNKKYHSSVPPLSIQHLSDCSKNANLTYRNMGCSGGYLWVSMWFAWSQGLYSQAAYPLNVQALQNGQSPACQTVNSPRYFISNWYSISKESSFCLTRINFLYSGYAVATTMFSGFQTFQFYHSGVLTTECPVTSTVDHGVLMVGFYYDNTVTNANSPTNYIRFKNSYGTSWGEGGYFRVSPYNNRCNICDSSEASV
jgi:C1A family cysteine protease